MAGQQAQRVRRSDRRLRRGHKISEAPRGAQDRPTKEVQDPSRSRSRGRSSTALRLAIFGGTFDPIHKAHLAIAREAADRFRLDRVLFVPAAHPPHKDGVTRPPYDDRVRMAELACAGEPRFAVSRLEEGTRCSYSIDTIEKGARLARADDELFFMIGADAFAEIRTWHRWQDVARARLFPGDQPARPSLRVPPLAVRVERLDRLELASRLRKSGGNSRVNTRRKCPPRSWTTLSSTDSTAPELLPDGLRPLLNEL